MSKFLKELREKFDSMSKEEFDEEWKELEKYNYGPTVEEYIESLKAAGLYQK